MDSGRNPVRLKTGGFPIRKSPDQSLRTAPRSISVFVPSFIGS
ncbi:DNA-binding protein [Heyndrickxia coagulans]|nr:DNA-binding protein [Heyndrickxia coagulans]RCS33916.1 DNA-binding protein [Heyndrickxia coagulans]